MQQSLQDVVRPVVADLGLELDSLTTVRAGARVVLRIALDGDGAAGRGLTVDDIATAAAAISRHLDETGAMGDQSYVLEVGSPGVDRPLTAPQHWRRNIGRLVKITPVSGQSWVDRVAGCDLTGVTLEGRGDVAFSDIRSAVVQVEMKAMPELED